jgi:hypothetical protein
VPWRERGKRIAARIENGGAWPMRGAVVATPSAARGRSEGQAEG